LQLSSHRRNKSIFILTAFVMVSHNTQSCTSRKKSEDTSTERRIEIRTLCKAGWNAKQIWKHLKSPSYRTIANICTKYKKTGSVFKQPRPGRPRKTTPKQDEAIAHIALEHCELGAERLKPIIHDKLKIRVSKSTIQRRLGNFRLKMKRLYKVPMLNQRHKFLRCYFAAINTDRDWRKVIFSDEKKKQLYRKNGFICVRPQERPIYPTLGHSPSVMFWGCFSWEVTSELIIMMGRLNHQRYIEYLEQGLIPFTEKLRHRHHTLVQDNGPPHRPVLVCNWLRDRHISVLGWPPNSPDLNLIENLWYILEQKVWERRPTTIQQLKEYCKKEWKHISQDTLKKLVSTMSHRLKAVLMLRGDTIPREYTGHICHKFKAKKLV
jgi:transposase